MRVHGANNGKNGGRVCWAVDGTLCGGRTQGTFAEKLGNCMTCAFYETVKKEELAGGLGAQAILAKLR